uniref:Uncharacterized protein n=1 Tax=Rhodopseudomonas palustris (strain BisA53) TaxID=316055 RepID=Q07NN3_RHOP5
MIPRTYSPGHPDDRYWHEDFWSWLKDQPQDAWFLWVRSAFWGNTEQIVDWMLDEPECDLAIVSFVFWRNHPGYWVLNPEALGSWRVSQIGKILRNLERRCYTGPALFYDRYEVLHQVHEYIDALKAKGTDLPFALPRLLCGPFNGRRARIPDAYDAETERDLAEVFQALGGWLPRSEQANWQEQKRGGNLAIADAMELPSVPRDPLQSFKALGDIDYLEAIFGRHDDFARAVERIRTPQTVISVEDGWKPPWCS